MTRILFVALAVMLAATVAACTRDGSTNGAGAPDDDAEAFKTEMDAFARETVPKPEAEVGGTWGDFSAHFAEKGGNTGDFAEDAGYTGLLK